MKIWLKAIWHVILDILISFLKFVVTSVIAVAIAAVVAAIMLAFNKFIRGVMPEGVDATMVLLTMLFGICVIFVLVGGIYIFVKNVIDEKRRLEEKAKVNEDAE